MLGSFSVPNMSLPCETLPGKMQFPFSSLFTVVMLKQKADENGAFGHQWKDSKTHTTDFERAASDKYPCVYCECFTQGTPSFGRDVMYATWNSQSFMSPCVMLCMLLGILNRSCHHV